MQFHEHFFYFATLCRLLSHLIELNQRRILKGKIFPCLLLILGSSFVGESILLRMVSQEVLAPLATNSSGDNKGMVRRGGNVRQIQELKLGFPTISPWLRGHNATSAHHPPLVGQGSVPGRGSCEFWQNFTSDIQITNMGKHVLLSPRQSCCLNVCITLLSVK